MLAEGHEDALLLGLVGEQVAGEEEPKRILRAGLERISMLKDIPFCACYALDQRRGYLVEHFASFTDRAPATSRVELPDRLVDALAIDSHHLDASDWAALGLDDVFGIARGALAVPFRSRAVSEGFFLFATDHDEERLNRATAFLHRICELLVARLDHAVLVEQLRTAQNVLERAVAERTRDLAERAAALEREIDEHRRTESALRHAQKMEAVGRLAGGVAHDFNNLLTVIINCSSMLAESASIGRPADLDEIEAIQTAGERARDLTRQLLAFARKQLVSPVALDPDAVVRKAEGLLRHVLREDISLEVCVQPGAWPVWSDPGQLEQVLMNLAVNARDAMPRGGRLALSVSNVCVPAGGPPDGPAAGDWVRLSVSDSGVGITSEVKAHLFEPFFTTKGPGEGTGLGLSTVYGIVTQAGGVVQVESEPGHGATFHVWLPRSSAGPHAPHEGAATAASPRGAETVLVVEDDALVRTLIVRILRGAGYEVLVAGRGDEALTLVARETRLDLLMTDVVMPGLGGCAVAQELRRLRPRLPVVFVSGYMEEALSGVPANEMALVPKPFTAEHLLGSVRALLDRTRA